MGASRVAHSFWGLGAGSQESRSRMAGDGKGKGGHKKKGAENWHKNQLSRLT